MGYLQTEAISGRLTFNDIIIIVEALNNAPIEVRPHPHPGKGGA